MKRAVCYRLLWMAHKHQECGHRSVLHVAGPRKLCECYTYQLFLRLLFMCLKENLTEPFTSLAVTFAPK